MQNFIIETMNQYGSIGIALLIAIENIFPPIPSEVILTFGGFMTTYSKISMLDVIIASTTGSLIGAIFLYGIGRVLNKDRLIAICNGKIGKVLRLKAENIEKSEKWFEKNSNYAVLFCRCIPIIRSLISIPAGMSKMNFLKFIILTTIGTVIWNVAVTYLGRFAGNSWGVISNGVSEYSHFIYIGILFILSFFIIKKIIGNKIIYFRAKK